MIETAPDSKQSEQSSIGISKSRFIHNLRKRGLLQAKNDLPLGNGSCQESVIVTPEKQTDLSQIKWGQILHLSNPPFYLASSLSLNGKRSLWSLVRGDASPLLPWAAILPPIAQVRMICRSLETIMMILVALIANIIVIVSHFSLRVIPGSSGVRWHGFRSWWAARLGTGWFLTSAFFFASRALGSITSGFLGKASSNSPCPSHSMLVPRLVKIRLQNKDDEMYIIEIKYNLPNQLTYYNFSKKKNFLTK